MHPHLKRLVIERHLSPTQANFIHLNWNDSPGDLWVQPLVSALGVHTTTYIDGLRGQFRSAVPFDSQEA